MSELDRLELERVDPSGMLSTVERSGSMWREAVDGLAERPAPERTGRPAGVVVAGMGGSGIAGDVAMLAADRDGLAPVTVVKGYELPRWVTSDHLVVGVSHSGNTEETLSLVEEATRRGCGLAAVTSGGQLGQLAADRGWWSATIPGGQQPRASLPYLVTPVLGLLAEVGALRDGALDGLDDVPAAVDAAVDRWGHDRPHDDNGAKRATAALAGRVPVFYGGRGLPALVALRAKCQVNENAAVPAFCNEVPERDHNELVGWSEPAPPFTLVEIRSSADEPEGVRRRFDAGAKELGDRVLPLVLEGHTWLTRLAVGVVLVDLISVYLALLRGVDPTPVEVIERLKRRIAAEANHA